MDAGLTDAFTRDVRILTVQLVEFLDTIGAVSEAMRIQGVVPHPHPQCTSALNEGAHGNGRSPQPHELPCIKLH